MKVAHFDFLKGLFLLATRCGRALLFAAASLTLLFGDESHADTLIFNSSTTWTAPAGVTSITVECWGAGGGGGGTDSYANSGGGGGGGAYSIKHLVSVMPGSTYAVTVGTGGAAGGYAAAGGAGGDSWFSTTGTVLARGGSGGFGGILDENGNGGAGGGAETGVGDTKRAGGSGAAGNYGVYDGGGGGSSAGIAAAGVSATGNAGANAPSGGGNGGKGENNTAAVAGVAPGGGGGGAASGGTAQAGAAGRVVLTWSNDTQRDAETWFNPTYTFQGSASSGFGSAISCSAENVGAGHSYFAIGAPLENAGDGRVHIYGPSGVVTTLLPPHAGLNGKFGSAVRFVQPIDTDSDALEELVIGEPGSDGTSGRFHVYLSGTGYARCGTRTGGVSYGTSLAATSNPVAGGVQLVIATLDSATIETVNVTHSSGVCTFTPVNDFNSTGPGGAGSRYGQSIQEIHSGGLQLLVGAPLNGGGTSAGAVFSKGSGSDPPALRYQGSADEKWGVSVAASVSSSLFGFAAPYTSADGGKVYIKYSSGPNAFDSHCAESVPMSDLPDSAGKSLALLEEMFVEFLQLPAHSTQRVFGAYSSQASTGGSVALVGAWGGGCVSGRRINNCQRDPSQRQGHVLAGGAGCVDHLGRKLLLVGAAGYSNDQGRVDVYAEGTELKSAAPCVAATPTATPTVTATPAPGFAGVPIRVDPKTANLPAPAIVFVSNVVEITAPSLATKDKKLRFIGWLFTLTWKNSKQKAVTALAFEASRKNNKRRQILSRQRRISLRNLQPGDYSVVYQPVFQRAKDKTSRIIGKRSLAAYFTVQ